MIEFYADGNRALVRPRYTLAAPDARIYADACKRAGFYADKKGEYLEGPLLAIPGLWEALEPAVPAILQPGALDVLERLYERSREAVAQAEERMNHARAWLQQEGLDFYPYQIRDIRRKASLLMSLLNANDVGMGKTLEVLYANPYDRLLVFCDKNALDTWRREAKKWLPDWKVTLLEGNGSFRWPQRHEIVALNYEILPPLEEEMLVHRSVTSWLMDFPAPLLVFCDEMQALKNDSARRTKRAREMLKGVRAQGGSTWGGTGTPVENHPDELYGILQGLGLAGLLFGTRDRFIELFGGQKQGKSVLWPDYEREPWRVDPTVPQILAQVMIRNDKEKNLGLPPRTRTHEIVEASLPPLVQAELDALEVYSRSEKDDERFWRRLHTPDERAGAYPSIRKFLAEAKIAAVEELIERDYKDKPLLVWSYHRAPVEYFGSKSGWAMIHGDISVAKRREAFDAFQAGEIDKLAMSIRAAKTSSTLTRAETALFVDHSDVPGHNHQAEGRNRRPGTLRPTFYRYFVLDHPVEVRVARICARKLGLIDATTHQVDDRLMETVETPMDRLGRFLEARRKDRIGSYIKLPPIPPVLLSNKAGADTGEKRELLSKALVVAHNHAQAYEGQAIGALVQTLTEGGQLSNIQWSHLRTLLQKFC